MLVVTTIPLKNKNIRLSGSYFAPSRKFNIKIFLFFQPKVLFEKIDSSKVEEFRQIYSGQQNCKVYRNNLCGYYFLHAEENDTPVKIFEVLEQALNICKSAMLLHCSYNKAWDADCHEAAGRALILRKMSASYM